ncbi:unnamed protein product [Eretmochelys imbricata]
MEMTNGKAAGAHKIPAEVQKHGSPILHKALLDPVTFCWENKVLPQDFKVTKIVIICKSKGDRHNYSNYRGILLFSITGRLLGVGSDPDIPVEGHQDGGIRVVCRSFGWYPEPEAQWRDLQGQVLPSASHNILQEATGLFQTEIAIVITEESNQKVSCSVRNPCLNQERVSTISIADLFFTFHIWVVALGVILGVIFCVLIALANYCSWSQCRAKETLQSAMERQKCQCLGPVGWVEDFMS